MPVDLVLYPTMYVCVALTDLTELARSTIESLGASWLLYLRIMPDVRYMLIDG